jgi:hypothetical protein
VFPITTGRTPHQFRTCLNQQDEVLVALLSALGIPLQPAAQGAQLVSSGDDVGAVLGVVGRQVAWLNLIAPRPQILTQLQAPAYTTDVAMLPDRPGAVVAVMQAFKAQTSLGGDLLRLDLAERTFSPLVLRVSDAESLGSPAWMPDGSQLFFDRADLTATPIQYAGQSYAYYPSRVEVVQPDGSGRTVVVNAARMPAVSPDGDPPCLPPLDARRHCATGPHTRRR